MIQTMGVRTAPAEVTAFTLTVRAFGTVETNERLETVSASRLEGWIQDLRVRAVGDVVAKGELLYRIYSPALLTAQKDYLLNLDKGDERRLAAVEQRLRSLGMQASVIRQLAASGQAIESVPVFAESGGTVSALSVREGDYVKPGDPLLRLQSYAEVWVIAQIAEQDLPLLRGDLRVKLAFPSAPDAADEGHVDYIYPTIDPATRTGQVRIVVDNERGSLRPGAYADVSIDLGGEPRLSVPTEALLRDSRGAHVIVALGEGRFAGQAVQTGTSAAGRTEILAGLEAGQSVVTSAQFLLDSEVNLREGLDKLTGTPEADPHAGHRH
jgi:Cu(I)/Ag(I) efflux system membrane fusion protein